MVILAYCLQGHYRKMSTKLHKAHVYTQNSGTDERIISSFLEKKNIFN
jgi:hypothetical protein